MSSKFFTYPLININGTITYLIDFEFQAPDGSRVIFLNHPLASKVFLKVEAKNFDELQSIQIQTQGKSDTQKQLEFCKKYEKYLGYEENLKLLLLCESFVINRSLGNEQKKNISDLCGTIAKIHLNNDIKLAVKIVNDNSPLLDDFNRNWYNNLKLYFSFSKEIDSRGKRSTIFNMSGFVLAQLDNV